MIESPCLFCRKSYLGRADQVYCSLECARSARREFNPTTETLRALIQEMPATTIAANYGVSDAAVRKRCRLLGIPTRPRGFWARLYAARRK